MAVAHKSVISFGLVSIPIGMYTATQGMPLKNGALNQSVFKGLRDDKVPKDCIEHN